MTHNPRNDPSVPGDRPFPWRCVKCLKKEVYPATIPYTTEVTHEGRLIEIKLPVLEIPRCLSCGELVFTNHVDEQIGEALRTHLQMLTPAQVKASY